MFAPKSAPNHARKPPFLGKNWIQGMNPHTQPVKMDLIKKFYPKQNDIQTFKVDPQGFRKTINENPPTQEFFKNPPEGSEHGQKCIKSKKNNTLYYKKTCCYPNFLQAKFFQLLFWLQVSKIAAKLRLEKKSYFGYGASEKKFACGKLG